MKWCSRIRIEGMLPDGTATAVKLLDLGWVSDDHDFGLRQETAPALSPVTQQLIVVYYPVLHIEGAPHPRGQEGHDHDDGLAQ